MDRYVFYHPLTLSARALTAAKKKATSLGATVVRSGAGAMLLEADGGAIKQVAKALPEWRYSAESKVHRLPERTPLQRARLKHG